MSLSDKAPNVFNPKAIDLKLLTPDVTAEIAMDADTRLVSVKIQSSTYELNVFLNSMDVDALLATSLPMVPDEKSLCAGESCGAPAHWSRDTTGTMGIVMGFDDTTWDFGVWMPCSTFDIIKALIADLRSQL